MRNYATSPFLDAGAISTAIGIINRMPWRPAKLPKQKPRTKRSSDQASTLSQTADAVYIEELEQYIDGTRDKMPKRLSGEYIRQIENRAIKHCLEYCLKNGLSLDDLLPRL